MSPRGHPDYVSGITQVYIEGLTGLEELATRLGSIAPWDLRGNIVLMEDFESELTEWHDGSSGGTSAVSRSSRHKYSGDWSVKLYKADVVDAEANLYRYFHFPGTLKYAAFARFCWDNTCRSIILDLGLCSGTRESYIAVKYDRPAETLSVLTTGDTYRSVATNLNLSQAVYTWYPVLVTFDLSTGYYDKLYLADKEYDISSIPLYYVEPCGNPRSYIVVIASFALPVSFTAYVDDIVLVKNVP